MKSLQVLLRARKLSELILRNMPLERIRDFVGAEFLSPVQRFISDGYNSKLFSNLEFLAGDKIVVLGGYIGESVQILDENYKQDVYVFEPVPEFIAVLKDRFKFKSNIKIIEAAASSEEGFLKLSIDGEKTGVNASGLEYLAPAIHFSNWLKNENLDIGLLEVNIEGGEYNLLSDLIESRQIKRIKTLLIQFHNNERNCEFQRASIRHLLQETHEQIFNYDWVWEKWKLMDDKQI